MKLAEKIPWMSRACKERRYLVGVSGGADSVALLKLLVEADFRDLVVCHLDHGLRAAASVGDADFVCKLALQLGLVCEIGHADVAAAMVKTGESLETAARRERHEFFAKCAGKYGSQEVVLAHHADDQAETVLWNLLRGSHGLKGMREVQEITFSNRAALKLIRPLLGLRREKLRAWLKAQGQEWREDASNQEPIGIRNRLRNELFPLLDKISGRDGVAAFVAGAEVEEDRKALDAWALAQIHPYDPQGRLHVAVIRNLPKELQRAVLKDYLKQQGIAQIDRNLIDRGLALLDPQAAAMVNLPGVWGRLRRREGRLWVER